MRVLNPKATSEPQSPALGKGQNNLVITLPFGEDN